MTEQSILYKSSSVYEQALHDDALLRGTGRVKERAFRETMQDFAKAYVDTLPPLLYEDILDHLTRIDGDGLNLCFAGPERERLLSVLYAWLDTHDPRAAAALRRALTTKGVTYAE